MKDSQSIEAMLRASTGHGITGSSGLTPVESSVFESTFTLTIFSDSYEAEQAIIESLQSITGVAISEEPITLNETQLTYKVMSQDELLYYMANDGRKVNPQDADLVGYYALDNDTVFIQHPFYNRPYYLADKEDGVLPRNTFTNQAYILEFGAIECKPGEAGEIDWEIVTISGIEILDDDDDDLETSPLD